MDAISETVTSILSLSIGGVSVVSIIGMMIYCIRLAIANKKNLTVTTQSIEEAFKNVVLPKNIKLDISNKIEKPIREGFEKVGDVINNTLAKMQRGEQLMMKILVLFTHYQKLPEDVREEIEDFINSETFETEIKL